MRPWLKKHKHKIKILTLILTIVGFLLAVFGFPVIHSFLAWQTGRFVSRPPVLKSVDYESEVLVGENVSLKAVLEHQDGLKVDFIWDCSPGRIEGNGPTVTLNTSGVVPKSAPLRIAVGLKIVDGYGRSDSRAFDVYVVPVSFSNKAPMLKTIKCNCATQEARAGDSVTLTAIAEDPDGDTLVYEWQSSTGQIEGEGQSVTLNTSSINPQSNFAPVKVTLTVKDQRGSSDSDYIEVKVLPKQAPQEFGSIRDFGSILAPFLGPPNSPPTLFMLQPTQSTIEIGGSVRLEALANDPNNDKLIYEWDASEGQIEGSGPTVTLNTAGIAPGRAPNRIIITLTVRDGRGASDSRKAFVTVTQAPKPETAQPSPTATPSAPLLIYPHWLLSGVLMRTRG